MRRWILPLLLLAAPAGATLAAEPWPPAPAGAVAELIVSGADFGYLAPLGCYHGQGGALLRLRLERWLARRGEPERIWLSTGDVLPAYEGGGNAGPELMYPHLVEVGYRAVGVSLRDLATATPAQIDEIVRGLSFRPLATTIVVWETGRSYFDPSASFTAGTGRWLVVTATRHDQRWLWTSPEGGTVVTVPPAKAVAEEIERRRGAYDRVLLLATLGQSALEDLLRRVPGIDLAIATIGGNPPPSPVTVGSTTVIWLGDGGRWLARIALGADGAPLATEIVPVGAELETFLDEAEALPRSPDAAR